MKPTLRTGIIFMPVDPPQPCGCNFTSARYGLDRVCGCEAHYGLLYGSMLLPICEICAAAFAVVYEEETKRR